MLQSDTMVSRRPDYTQAIARVVRRRVGAVREDHALAALEYADELDAIAQSHAEDMALRGELAHELGGTTPQDRADEYSQVGENIHRQQSHRTNATGIGRATVQAWVDSAEHYRLLIRESATVAGVGVAESGDWIYACLLISSGKKAHRRVTTTVRRWLES